LLKRSDYHGEKKKAKVKFTSDILSSWSGQSREHTTDALSSFPFSTKSRLLLPLNDWKQQKSRKWIDYRNLFLYSLSGIKFVCFIGVGYSDGIYFKLEALAGLET
jgi:hypothetical protein